jgi:hypothetical protein
MFFHPDLHTQWYWHQQLTQVQSDQSGHPANTNPDRPRSQRRQSGNSHDKQSVKRRYTYDTTQQPPDTRPD